LQQLRLLLLLLLLEALDLKVQRLIGLYQLDQRHVLHWAPRAGRVGASRKHRGRVGSTQLWGRRCAWGSSSIPDLQRFA